MTLVRRLTVASAIVFGVGLSLSLLVRIGAVADLDLEATRWLHDRAVDGATTSAVALDISALGSPVTLAAYVAIAAGWLLFHRRSSAALWLVAVTAVGGVVESLLKLAVGRSRPDLDSAFVDPVTKSFPSGHAMNTTVVLGAIAIAVVASATPRRVTAVRTAAIGAAVGALVIGLTRPVLGVHFVTDIVAGWLLGVIWLVAVRPRSDEELSVATAPPSG